MNNGFRKDMINFIGHRVVVAHQDIKPKLGDVISSEEDACAEQEAVYLVGLADGLALAELLASRKQGDGDCFKESGTSL